MGLVEQQRALARLSVDKAFRDRFFADPAAGGCEVGLDPDESQNLAKAPRPHIKQFAESLARKRRDQVRRSIPIAARAMGAHFAGLFGRYAALAAARGSKPDLADAAAFVEAIRRETDRIEPEWAVDMARYELTWRQAASAGRTPIVRLFQFPVARLAIRQGLDPVVRRATLALWWRPAVRGKIKHIVFSIPTLRSGSRAGS